MPAYSLYALPTDDFVGGCTISMTNPNATFPASNMKNYDPAIVAKATSTGTVITMTGLANVTIAAFAIINHNLVGATVTLTNGAGYSQTITIPARSEDGLCINAWRDCRLDANRTDDVWTLTISGASANVQIGRLYLATTLFELSWKWGVEFEEEHLVTERKYTFLGSRIQYDKGVRIRRGSGETTDEAVKDQILSLHRAAKGAYLPWLFIPDYTVNDAWYVQFQEPKLVFKREAPEYAPTAVKVEEVSMGLVL